MRVLLTITAALMMISCSSVPVTPLLPVPVKPDYPRFTQQEIETLNACMKDDKPTCEVLDDTLRKMRDKDIKARGYAKEAVTIIETNNKYIAIKK